MADHIFRFVSEKVSKFSALFDLNVVASPKVIEGWGFSAGELSPLVVGIPFCPTLNSSRTLPSPISEFSDDDVRTSTVSTLSGNLRLSTRQRRQFKRFVQALHLEKRLYYNSKEIHKASCYELASNFPGREDGPKEEGGMFDSSRWLNGARLSEPRLLLVHLSRQFF